MLSANIIPRFFMFLAGLSVVILSPEIGYTEKIPEVRKLARIRAGFVSLEFDKMVIQDIVGEHGEIFHDIRKYKGIYRSDLKKIRWNTISSSLVEQTFVAGEAQNISSFGSIVKVKVPDPEIIFNMPDWLDTKFYSFSRKNGEVEVLKSDGNTRTLLASIKFDENSLPVMYLIFNSLKLTSEEYSFEWKYTKGWWFPSKITHRILGSKKRTIGEVFFSNVMVNGNVSSTLFGEGR